MTRRKRGERGNYSRDTYTHTHTGSGKNWATGLGFISGINPGASQVQPGNLHITRDKLCVCMRACVGGSRGVTCNHKTPQMETHVGGPERNLRSSPRCIHAIFGASGFLFSQSGQTSSTVCTPSGPCVKKPSQKVWTCFACSDRLFSAILKHPSRCHSQVCGRNKKQIFFFILPGVFATPAGAWSLRVRIHTHTASAANSY